MSIITRTCSALSIISLSLASMMTHAADYGGIALGATRIVYPQGSEQISLSVNNTDSKGVFLVQSWVENSDSKKSSNFVVTPPLFVINPEKENTLRVMYIGPRESLPKDRESLYWMNVKAIPAANKDAATKNTLQIAVLNRIKLFIRPQGLAMSVAEAPEKLRFHKDGKQLTIKNPSPYYITLVHFNDGATELPATMVPPLGQSTIVVPESARGQITFQTVNDYGANTPKQNAVIE